MSPLEGSRIAWSHGADGQVGNDQTSADQGTSHDPGGQHLDDCLADDGHVSAERGRLDGGARLGLRRRHRFGHLGQDPIGVRRTNDIG